MAIVAFDLAGFRATYPELSAVPDPALQAYFVMATVYLDNTNDSIVDDVTYRSIFLNMLVAHIAQLHNPATTQGQAQLVGRISNAREGTVSVSVEMPGANADSAWYLQTKYGADYWEAISAYRTARYALSPFIPSPFPFGGPAAPWLGGRWTL